MFLSDFKNFFLPSREKRTKTARKIKKIFSTQKKFFSIFVFFFLILGNNRKCQEDFRMNFKKLIFSLFLVPFLCEFFFR